LDKGRVSHDDKVGLRWSCGVVLMLLNGQLVVLVSVAAMVVGGGVLEKDRHRGFHGVNGLICGGFGWMGERRR